ncbi:MAG TPA: cytochrome P450 [Pseudonocardiaceae bacterium]|nr:cytochrome P450 [Pseudonocardiales bacterium]HZS20690.1 cytochrome P450 [Pseudonocardiaceae bacterium]
MTATAQVADPQAHPLAPWVTLPWLQRLRAVTAYHTGAERIRDVSGPVALIKLGPRRITPVAAMVTSPQGARDVLAGTDAAIDKEMIVHVESRLHGDNVFNMAHEQWLPRRRALQPLFTKQHVATFSGHMAGAAEELAASWASGRQVDLDQDCRTLTLRVIGRSIFGLELGERAGQLGPHITRILLYPSRRALRPVRVPAALPTPARWRFRKSMAVIHQVVEEALTAFRADPSRDAPLVRRLVQTTDPATGQPLTDKAIRDELITFLVAGHDTTATTLTYALWALGHHTQMQDRVAAEASALGPRMLTVDDVPHLSYTVQVIHEALRLCPPAAAIGRLAMTDIVVDGFRIPAGTNLIVGTYALHRDPALWDDPQRFDPDRFAAHRSKGRNRWQYLPFGAGPRSCIGDHFAMLEATLGLATLVRAVEICSIDDEFPLALPFTMTAGGPIPATVHHRA